MFRQSLATIARPALRSTLLQTRALSVSAVRMNSEGATGGTRPGGSASDDAFSKREKANEDYYVRQQEKEKLRKLKEKVAVQKKHLKELEDHIEELGKEAGGEKN